MLCVELFEFHESIFGLRKVNLLTFGYYKEYFSACRLVMIKKINIEQKP